MYKLHENTVFFETGGCDNNNLKVFYSQHTDCFNDALRNRLEVTLNQVFNTLSSFYTSTRNSQLIDKLKMNVRFFQRNNAKVYP